MRTHRYRYIVYWQNYKLLCILYYISLLDNSLKVFLSHKNVFFCALCSCCQIWLFSSQIFFQVISSFLRILHSNQKKVQHLPISDYKRGSWPTDFFVSFLISMFLNYVSLQKVLLSSIVEFASLLAFWIFYYVKSARNR